MAANASRTALLLKIIVWAQVQFSLGQRDFPAYTAGHGHERAFQDLRRRSPRPGWQRHLEGTAAARLQEFDWPDAPGGGLAGRGGGNKILRGGAAGIRVCGRGQSGRHSGERPGTRRVLIRESAAPEPSPARRLSGGSEKA